MYKSWATDGRLVTFPRLGPSRLQAKPNCATLATRIRGRSGVLCNVSIYPVPHVVTPTCNRVSKTSDLWHYRWGMTIVSACLLTIGCMNKLLVRFASMQVSTVRECVLFRNIGSWGPTGTHGHTIQPRGSFRAPRNIATNMSAIVL